MVKAKVLTTLIFLVPSRIGIAMVTTSSDHKRKMCNFTSDASSQASISQVIYTELAETFQPKKPAPQKPIHIYQTNVQQSAAHSESIATSSLSVTTPQFIVAQTLPPISFGDLFPSENPEERKKEEMLKKITKLEKAVQEQNLAEAGKLLYPLDNSGDVDPNAISSSGKPIFFLTIESQPNSKPNSNDPQTSSEIAQLFLRHKKFNPNLKDEKSGLTALAAAIKNGSSTTLTIAQILLWKSGVEVNCLDKQNYTALDYAEKMPKRNATIIRLLNGRGAKRGKDLLAAQEKSPVTPKTSS